MFSVVRKGREIDVMNCNTNVTKRITTPKEQNVETRAIVEEVVAGGGGRGEGKVKTF